MWCKRLLLTSKETVSRRRTMTSSQVAGNSREPARCFRRSHDEKHISRFARGLAATDMGSNLYRLGSGQMFQTMRYSAENVARISFGISIGSVKYGSELDVYSFVKPTTGQFTRFPVVFTGPPAGLTSRPASLLVSRSSPSVISVRFPFAIAASVHAASRTSHIGE